MAYDPARGAVLLCGGRDNQGAILSDTWSWDGNNWTQLEASMPQVPSSSLLYPLLAHDPKRSRMVLFYRSLGSGQGGGWKAFESGAPAAASTASVGSSCNGAQGAPVLAPVGLPRIGREYFGLDLSDAAPGAPSALILGTAVQSIPLGGGCELNVQPSSIFAILNGTSNSTGYSYWPIPIPADPTLYGASVATQSVIFDPQGSFQGSAWTRGVELRLGD